MTLSPDIKLSTVILAAGKGTRMRSDLPKVLHKLAERPLLEHVVDTARSISDDDIHVVIGHGGELVKQQLVHKDRIDWIEQIEHEQKAACRTTNHYCAAGDLFQNILRKQA